MSGDNAISISNILLESRLREINLFKFYVNDLKKISIVFQLFFINGDGKNINHNITIFCADFLSCRRLFKIILFIENIGSRCCCLIQI